MTMLDAWAGLRIDSPQPVRDQHVLIVAPLGHCMIGLPIHPKLFAADAASIVVSTAIAAEFFAGNTNGTQPNTQPNTHTHARTHTHTHTHTPAHTHTRSETGTRAHLHTPCGMVMCC